MTTPPPPPPVGEPPAGHDVAWEQLASGIGSVLLGIAVVVLDLRFDAFDILFDPFGQYLVLNGLGRVLRATPASPYATWVSTLAWIALVLSVGVELDALTTGVAPAEPFATEGTFATLLALAQSVGTLLLGLHLSAGLPEPLERRWRVVAGFHGVEAVLVALAAIVPSPTAVVLLPVMVVSGFLLLMALAETRREGRGRAAGPDLSG